jgi:biotin-(acetyl-CoA carboxylase) ligase
MVWDQHSQEGQDKLESSNDWDKIQREQLLHHLINKIERICIRFDDHKQKNVQYSASAQNSVSLHPGQQREHGGTLTQLYYKSGND